MESNNQNHSNEEKNENVFNHLEKTNGAKSAINNASLGNADTVHFNSERINARNSSSSRVKPVKPNPYANVEISDPDDTSHDQTLKSLQRRKQRHHRRRVNTWSENALVCKIENGCSNRDDDSVVRNIEASAKLNEEEHSPSVKEKDISMDPKNTFSVPKSSKNSDVDASSGETVVNYNARKVIGNGSFGVVFEATVVETGQVVAIKKVLQDKRFKNRELQIMRKLSHCNIVHLIHCFYSRDDKKEDVYLHLVLEYVPKTVWEICKSFHRSRKYLPIQYVKLYTYQLCRALAYIHSLGICHRDIKPQNLLVDTRNTHALKLCDFGSAKILVKGEPNVAYICSRYYRAPELIFGCTDYTTEIDTWSLGCVVAEMLLSRPLFPGECGVDQLVEIIKVLGTPTKEQIYSMNRHYSELQFPDIKKNPWKNVFHPSTDADAVDLVSKILAYDPHKRSKPMSSCTHSFFDSLRDNSITFNHDMPPLFNFDASELEHCSPDEIYKLVPPQHRRGKEWEKILKFPQFDDNMEGAIVNGSALSSPTKK